MAVSLRRTCPNCSERQPLARVLVPDTGAKWASPGCGTLLTFDVGRRFLFGSLAMAMLLASLVAAFLSPSWLYLGLGAVGVVFLLCMVPAGRPKRVSGDSGPYCPQCHYHLEATVLAGSARCPECGAPVPPKAA